MAPPYILVGTNIPSVWHHILEDQYLLCIMLIMILKMSLIILTVISAIFI